MSVEDLVFLKIIQGVGTSEGLRDTLGLAPADVEHAVSRLLSRRVIEIHSAGYELAGALLLDPPSKAAARTCSSAGASN